MRNTFIFALITLLLTFSSLIVSCQSNVAGIRKAAEQGDANAQFELALNYAAGEGVPQDHKEAVKWLRKAADNGHAFAQTTLGFKYAAGRGVPQDFKEAVKWYRKAAEKEDAFAQYLLGEMYKLGLGVKRDYEEAVKWYRKSAEQEYALGQYSLGIMYGNGEGVSQDLEEAVKWYQKAAEQGDANAQHDLGLSYKFGKGIPQDYKESIKWFRKAAEQGNADGQYERGLMFAAKRRPQDDKEAAKWYRKAAKQGHSKAQYLLGIKYYRGQGVSKSNKKAVKWLRKAAEQGFAGAQFDLGIMYLEGRGVRKDKEEAVKWYRKAAEQGNAPAQFALGYAYGYGVGVSKSQLAAVDWFYKAGQSYLKNERKEDALRCAENINKYSAGHPLGKKLLAQIYGNEPASSAPEQKQKGQVLSGTGWISASGLIVTNYHVVKGAKEISLALPNGKQIDATVAATDKYNDIAILKVASPNQLPRGIPFSRSKTRIGGSVFTIGYPHPNVMGKAAKMTSGKVNALSGVQDDPRTFQISVPLQSGNSGGPLLNMNGEAVGIVTSKLSAAKMFKWTGDLPQNVNYAIKIGYVKMLFESIDTETAKTPLSRKAAPLEELVDRVEDSIVMVIAK